MKDSQMKKTEFNTRIDRIAHKMLDRLERILEVVNRRLAPAPAGPLTRGDVAVFRWTNDQFGLWRLCANRSCRRPRGCRGEPQLCLERHLPQVPQKARDRVRHRLADAMRDYRTSSVQGQAISFQNHSPSTLIQHGPTP
jgi:hypothetical protein